MKLPRIFIFLIIILFTTACDGLNNEQIVLSDTASPVSITPQPSKTHQPTKTVRPTQTIVPTPNVCSKQTVPTDAIGESQSDLYTDKLIAYTLDNNQGSNDIYISNWDGQHKRNITNHPADDGDPQWSPDGEYISFLSNRNSPLNFSCSGASDECKYKLFIIKPNGAGLKQITKEWTFSPSWSPNNKQIVFLGAFKSELSPNPNDPFLYDIFVVNSDGTNLRNLTNSPGYYSDPVWSPDGQQIAFQFEGMATYPPSIKIISADGTSLSAYSERQAYEMVWAPNGHSLLFATRPNNSSGNDLYKLKVDTSTLEQLTFSPHDTKETLSLSPDGKWLAYHLRSDYQQLGNMCDQVRVLNTETLKDYFVYDAKDIEKIPLNESGSTPLYFPVSISSLIWRPDSKQLIFRQGYQIPMIYGDFSDNFSIELDGSHLEHFDANVEAIQP